MRDDWQFVKIGSICKTGAGGTPRKSEKKYYEGGEVPWLLSGEVDNRNIFSAKQSITSLALKETSAKVFPVDTVLIAMYGATAGKVGVLKFEAATNQAVCGIYPSARIRTEFLYYALLHLQESIVAKASGNAQPNISQVKVRDTEIPLPPLPEQKRIVAILDGAFAAIDQAIANTEKNLANARELFDSHLNAIFNQRGKGWINQTVGELAEHCLGKMLDKAKNKGTMRPYLRNVNVRWFEVDISDLLEMRIENNEVGRYEVIKGDLLICEGGYPGRAAIWMHDETIFFQKALHRVRCHDAIYNKWLLFYLHLADVNGELRKHFTGTGIQHLTGAALKRFNVPVAPTPEVETVLSNMDELQRKTQRLEGMFRQKLTALTELKQSLLQKAFTGELTADHAARDMA